jgi:hypothetical protein
LSFIWLTLTPAYSIISYENIVFDLCPLFQECSYGAKQGLGVYINVQFYLLFMLCNFMLVGVLTAQCQQKHTCTYESTWRTLHNESLHSFCSLPNITVVTKWRSIRCARYALVGDMRNANKILVERHENLSKIWRVILQCIIE